MRPAELLQRLDLTRRRVQRLTAWEQLLRLIAAAAGVLLIAIAIDAWVRVPAPLRAAGTLIALFEAVRRIRGRVLAPLRADIPLREIAARLDARNAALDWRLSTAMEHAVNPATIAGPLDARVLDEALAAVDRLDWERVTDARPSRRQARRALSATAAVVLAAAFWPALLTIGIPRYVWPFGPAEWPKRVNLEPMTRDLIAVRGAPVTLEVEVTEGWSRRLKAWVVWRDASGRRREPMNAASDGRYTYTSPRVTQDATYWFESGDDSTAPAAARIRVVDRPILVSAALEIVPPAYVREPVRVVALTPDARTNVLQGCQLRLRLRWSKPLAPRAAEPAAVVTSGERRIACMAIDATGHEWEAQFTADAGGVVEATCTDADGLSPEPPPRFQIEVRPDASPRITIHEPPPLLDAAPDAVIVIDAAARDDYGIETVRLHLRMAHRPESPAEARSIWPAVGSQPVDRRDVLIEYEWPLASLQAAAGSTIEYWLEADDSYQAGNERHAPARSAVMRIRIVTRDELASRLWDEFAAVIRRLQQTAVDQRALAALAARSAMAASQPTEDDPTLNARALAARQKLLTESVTAAADRIDALLDRAEEQRLEHAAAARQRGLVDALRLLADEPMREAEAALRAVQPPARRESPDGGENRQAAVGLDRAAKAQEMSAARLEALLRQFEQLNDLGAVVQKTRDLLDRQEALARDTAAATRGLAGRPAAELTDAERAPLSELAGREEGLFRDLNDMLKKVEQLADARQERDRSAAEALRQARETAERESVAARMQDATEAIRQNRGGQASDSQQAAAAGLRSMIAGMGAEQRRQLAELSKQLAAVHEQLDRLIKAQREVRSRTESAAKAADDDALLELSPRQRTLADNAGPLAERIAESAPDADRVAGLVRTAKDQMNAAASRLDQVESAAALSAQTEAIESLNEAAAALADLQNSAQKQEAELALADLRERLGVIRQEQAAIHREARAIATRLEKTKRPTRRDTVDLQRAATRQKELSGRMTGLASETPDAVVFEYVCRQIGVDMAEAATALQRRRTVEAAASQEQILARIDGLLAALAEAKPGAESKFAAGDTGGGDAAPAPQPKKGVIPSTAQLRMLRRVQTQLNQSVAQMDRSLGGSDPLTDAQQAEAAGLGRKQVEIRDLALKLIQGAQKTESAEEPEQEEHP